MNPLSDNRSSCFNTRSWSTHLLRVGIIFLLAAPAQAERPDFQEIVQPLLTRYCYKCHGNNDATRKADLNLEYYQTVESLSTMPDMLRWRCPGCPAWLTAETTRWWMPPSHRAGSSA